VLYSGARRGSQEGCRSDNRESLRPKSDLRLVASDYDGGIRISPQHVGAIADALEAARPFVEEWQRDHDKARGREVSHRRASA
jgi:hypothetical protein